MPAPVAVYILFGVVGAAAASFAFKEFVYEPHLAEKIEGLKYTVRAYYRRQRAARELARAQPLRSDTEGDNKDIEGCMGHNAVNLEMQGLFEPLSSASSEATVTRMRANAGAAVSSLPYSPPHAISKTTSAYTHGALTHDNQRIRQRNHAPQSVDELLRLEEKSTAVTDDHITQFASTTNSLNPLLDPNAHSVNVEARHSNSFGVESLIILSSSRSPRSEANALPEIPSNHYFSNPWEAISRDASPLSATTINTVTSSASDSETGFEHIQGDVLDVSALASLSSRDIPTGTNSHRPVTSPEIAWPSDENDNVSEASFSTGTTAFSSSIGSDAGEVNRELGPLLGNVVVEYTDGSVNSLSDSEWEHFSDIGH